MSKMIEGIGASSGIAIAKAFRLEAPDLHIDKRTIDDATSEMTRFEQALEDAKQELEDLRDKTKKELGEEKAEIFSAHLLVLSDPELINPIKDTIANERINAEFALNEMANNFITMFEQMDNEYMKERASDIRDVTKRVMIHLLGLKHASLGSISAEVIIIAEDLTPSVTAQLNREFVKGFATDIGGRTSHSAIMARSMEIPAVVGTKTVMADIENDSLVIVDGNAGKVIVNPPTELVQQYEQKQQGFMQLQAEWATLVNEKTVTKDGKHVELVANIGNPSDIEGVLNNGGEGIGLYRTEFLYMGRDSLPTEDEQYDSYKKVLEGMAGKPVVVRTLDIGGDKELPYLALPDELNPFLGFRAIRLCLEKQDIFRTQLRALLRASTYGNLKIMFPMIATLEEYRQAKGILEEEREQLIKQGGKVAEQIEVGIMVEIPSTAVIADKFAKEVDFFSIGTNDLIQYTMAADRMNEQVSYLYQPYHPAIINLVQNVINAAHKEGKWAGMCGEMAGDPIAIPLLLGLGLDEFSMSATSILPARSLIAKLSMEETAKLAEKAVNMRSAEEVAALVKDTFPH